MKKRLLWIEDDADKLHNMVYPLIKCGFEITEAKDARDARDIISKKEFDIIILDILIPEGEKEYGKYGCFVGLELLRKIKHKVKKTPIIVFTVVEDKELFKCLDDLGVYKIIEKSRYLPSQLKADIDIILDSKK